MKILLTLLALLSTITAFTQPPDLRGVKLKSKSSYALAEPKVLEAAKYVLATPPDAEGRDQCAQLMFNWMNGTKDYTFEVDASIIHNEDLALLGVFLSGMVRFVLENKAEAADQKQVKVNAVRAIFIYCADSTHNTPLPKNLQKLQQADQEGKLADLLN